MPKRKLKLSPEQKMLVELESVAKGNSQYKEVARSMINWFLVHHEWTFNQRQYIKTIITSKYVEKGKKRSPVEGKKHYLYGISDGYMIKLGYTSNIPKRLKDLQTANGRELKVIWKFYTGKGTKAARAAEKHLHRFMKKYHEGGEWYSLDCVDKLNDFKVKE